MGTWGKIRACWRRKHCIGNSTIVNVYNTRNGILNRDVNISKHVRHGLCCEECTYPLSHRLDSPGFCADEHDLGVYIR